MCGIVSVFGKYEYKNYEIFEMMLKLNVFRGDNSTGVASIFQDNTFAIEKSLGTPWHLFDWSDYDNTIKLPTYTTIVKKNKKVYHVKTPICLLGHGRAATRGKVSIDNAHPFQHEHILGVHNGTLHYWHNLTNKKFETDSEAIIYSIMEKGIEETWKLLDGAAALVWWDLKEKTFNFIRNNKRPLIFTSSLEEDKIYVTSTTWIMKALKEFTNVKTKELYIPKEDYLHTFSFDEGKTKVETKKLEPFKYPVSKYHDNKFKKGWDSIWGGFNKEVKEKDKKNEHNQCYICEDTLVGDEKIKEIEEGRKICSFCVKDLEDNGVTLENLAAWKGL